MAPPKQGVTARNGNNVFRGRATQRTRYRGGSSTAPDQEINVQGGENIFEGDFSQEAEEIAAAGGGNNPNQPNIIIIPPDNRRCDPTPNPDPGPRANPGGLPGHTPGQSTVSVPGAGMQTVCPACGIIWARNNSMANYQTLLRGGHIYS
ncbi:uncharacterized protein LOC127810911 isoform X4 [Diospyros lotus]|uniref:uncharacterized protein LOC127810911 isoform X3 n=1 Tax=Diospyros lotus TaxID=55363 RepID=UPI0022572B88|nr:uncharacterized protein LOC127810911 isoform X3 [Diospyros lotus]XP_052206480.1 uncharacterized protein LOC127810911 isoform X4 [Diospyros lotus]